jgi:hypothetical protein
MIREYACGTTCFLSKALFLNGDCQAVSHALVRELQSTLLNWGRRNEPITQELARHQALAAQHCTSWHQAPGRLVQMTSSEVQKQESSAVVDWQSLTPINGADLKLFETARSRVLLGTIIGDPISAVRQLSLRIERVLLDQ